MMAFGAAAMVVSIARCCGVVAVVALVAVGESVSGLPLCSQCSRGWGSATAVEVKKRSESSQPNCHQEFEGIRFFENFISHKNRVTCDINPMF
jgi:hypothetical protein